MDVKLEDGTVVTNVPEGTTRSQLMARLGRVSPEPKRADTSIQPESMVDKAALAADKVISRMGESVPDFLPNRQNIVDMATGASGLMRGTANQVGNLVGAGDVGEKIWPSSQSTHGGWETAGRMVDPVAMTIASGTGYHPVLGNGIKQGLMALGKNVLSGAATGGTIGTLSDQGTGKEGAIAGAAASLIGPLIEGGGALYRGGKNLIDPFLEGGTERAASQTAKKLTGNRTQAVLQALDNPDQFVPNSPVTAGEAAAKAGSAEFSGLEKALKPTLPSDYDQIAQAQKNARISLLRGIGRDTTAERTAITAPMREAAIENANIAGQKLPIYNEAAQNSRQSMISAMQNRGQLQTDAAQQGVLSQGGVVPPSLGGTGNPSPSAIPVPGLPRIPPRYTENAERIPEYLSGANDFANAEATRRAQAQFANAQAQSLAAHGNFPLQAQSVTSGINKILNTPGPRASDIVQKTLGSVRDKIASLTNEKGIIDANDLYTIRKEAGNVINQYAKETNNFDKRLTAGLQRDIQGYIDDAINSAAGSSNGQPMWSAYLQKYSELSKPNDQRIIAQTLEDKLNPVLNDFGAENPQRGILYANALKEAKDSTSVSGRLRWNSMDPDQIRKLDALGNDIGRQTENARLGSLGVAKARQILGQIEPPLPSAGMLSPKYSLLRAASNRLHGMAQGKSVDYLAEAMKDPKKMADLLRMSDPQTKQMLDQFLKNYQPAMMAGIISAGQGEQ